MTKEDFSYLWEQGILKAAKDVIDEIDKSLPNGLDKYNVRLNTSSDIFSRLYKEYEKFRLQIRNMYFDTGENNENLIDTHKICACITGALLMVHLVSFEKDDDEIPLCVVYSNYSISFLAGIYIQYLFLLSDYKRDGCDDYYKELKKQSTFYFPETNYGHDSYVLGRIKTLALNDVYGNDFDVLTYADMLFWIEKYNKDLLDKKIKSKDGLVYSGS